MNTIALLLIGAFIGWNIPQPFWAKLLQEKVKTSWNNFRNK